MFTSFKDKHEWYLQLIKSGMQGNKVIVAYIIASNVNGENNDLNGWSWPTHEQIAEAMGRKFTKANDNLISGWIKDLETNGWILIHKRGRKNFYRLTNPLP